MFPSEYTVRQHNRDLLREAEQRRLARSLRTSQPVSQRLGQTLIKLGARFAAQDGAECVTVENRAGQVVTVCAA